MGKLLKNLGWLGNYKLEKQFNVYYYTYTKSGVPFDLTTGTAGAVVVYEDASDTELTPSVTSTYNVNSVTGFNKISFTAAATDGFNNGSDYTILRYGMSIDSEFLSAVIASFSIDSRN